MELRALDRQLAANAELGARNRILFSSVDSTNRFGKRIAAHYRQVGESLPETVILALAQSNGRGRLGHVWLSPPGGVYISLVWPVGDPARLSELPMRVVTNVCREVDELVDGTCRVKWPNDLLVGGRKVGGILIETVGQGESLVAIVGLGLNHSGDLAGLPPNATNLAAEARGVASFGNVAGRMMAALVASLADSEGVEAVIEDYSRWSQHEIGQELRCRTIHESFSGTFLGFDRRGFLRLRTTTGDRLVTAGEIIEGEEANHHEAQ